jgi:hypothetical protein
MSGIQHLLLGSGGIKAEAPPSVPVTPTPTGRYFRFTSSQPFTITGNSPIPVSLVVVGGGQPGTAGVLTPDPKFPGAAGGVGGKGGVVNSQPSTTLAPGSYSIVVGAANATSGIYSPPATAIFTAAGGSSNPKSNGVPGEPQSTYIYGGGGGAGDNAGSPAPASPAFRGGNGGAGRGVTFGQFGGGGGGGAGAPGPGTPGGAGGTGGGGDGGASSGSFQVGYPGTVNTGGGGGGGMARISPIDTTQGGNGGSGIVIIQVPPAVG